MTVSPLPARSISDQRPGRHLVSAAANRVRHAPTSDGIARRRFAINLTKWLLPALAVMLLASIALWPEIERATDSARVAVRRMSDVATGQMGDARYHGVDDHGRPYTVTADAAQQDGDDRINLTMPKGDITLSDGTWLMVHAKQGVFLQHSSQLDLSHDVTLYRDDGTTMVTASASIDLKNGAGAGSEPTHAEGPFGTLDAQGGFTLVDKGAIIQFIGPIHLVLNGSSR
jgi:lipopolysaccharide export system protein LptC